MELLQLGLVCQRWSATTATGEGTLQGSAGPLRTQEGMYQWRHQGDGVGSYDWNFQAEEELTHYALVAFTSSSSSSIDNEVASCSKACLESIKARLLVYQHNETVFEEDIKLLKLDVELRDNALLALRMKFEKAEQERDELKLKLENFQTSSKNLSQLLASKTNDKIRLGYDNQVFTSSMFDCDELFSSKSDVSMPASLVYDRYKSGEGYHVVHPFYTGTFMPPNLTWFFKMLPLLMRLSILPSMLSLVLLSLPKIYLTPLGHKPLSLRIGSLTQKMNLRLSLHKNAPSFDQRPEHVKTPRPSIKPAKHPIPDDKLRKDSLKSRVHSNSRNKKACFVCKSLTYLIKDCDYYEKQMFQKPTKNHA
nr:hypothetical protein [Tanacetum cinerariifolium]